LKFNLQHTAPSPVSSPNSIFRPPSFRSVFISPTPKKGALFKNSIIPLFISFNCLIHKLCNLNMPSVRTAASIFRTLRP